LQTLVCQGLNFDHIGSGAQPDHIKEVRKGDEVKNLVLNAPSTNFCFDSFFWKIRVARKKYFYSLPICED